MRNCDVNVDENVKYKDKEKKGSETMKQQGVEVELRKNPLNDVTPNTQETLRLFLRN